MDQNRSKTSQQNVFHYNLCGVRWFAPFSVWRSWSVECGMYLLEHMAAEFLTTQFTQGIVYVYLVKYDILSCASLF